MQVRSSKDLTPSPLHLAEHDEQFRLVFEAIRQLLREDEKPKRKIGF